MIKLPHCSILIYALLGCMLLSCSSGHNDSDADKVRTTAMERLRAEKTYLLLPGMDEAISYYIETNDTIHLLEMYKLASIKMGWLGKQDSAAIYLHKALDLASANTPLECDIFLELANLYSSPLSKKNYRRAIEYAAKAYATDSSGEHRAGILHDIGIYHAFLNENDSATLFLEKALARTPASSPEYTQLALNYANLPAPEFDKSIRYLDSIESVSLGKLITKGFLYLNHGYPDSAAKYVRYSGDLYYSSPDRYSINTYNNLRVLSNCVAYAMSGKVYPGEGTEINDLISERLALNKKIAAETEEHNNALEIQLLASRARAQRAVIVALVVILLGGMAFALAFWSGKRKYINLHKELDSLRQNQIVIEAENGDSEEPVGLFGITVKRAGICIDRFRETGLLELIQKGENACNETGAYLSVKDRATVRQALLDCFADFIVDLKMDAGKLTMDDIITTMLGVMRVSNYGIAACLGTSIGAVRTRKTRLKGKLSPQMSEFVFG